MLRSSSHSAAPRAFALACLLLGGSASLLGPQTVLAAKPSANAPVISGAPATTAIVGGAYSFQPAASDADGDRLSFSIANKPIWASFSTTSGALQGRPSAAGVFSSIVITVSDGKRKASLPAFSISVASAPVNAAPAISGTPSPAINAGGLYSFRPTASDANGDALTFSISGRPAWSTFNASTGQLSGTPSAADVGVYSNISISVSDGQASASLAAFSIAVNAISSGAATLNWTAPTQNTDGSALTNLAGYRIQYGTSTASMTQTIQVTNPGLSTYVIENLSPATYYFVVKVYNTANAESAQSNIASKVVQ